MKWFRADGRLTDTPNSFGTPFRWPQDVRTAISLLLEAGAAVPPALLRAPRSLQAAVTVPAGWRNGAAVRVTHGGHVMVHVEGVLHHDALDDATDPEAIRQARHALRSVAAVHVRVALVPAAASPVAHQQLLGSARPRLAERVALTYMTSGAAGPPDPILQVRRQPRRRRQTYPAAAVR